MTGQQNKYPDNAFDSPKMRITSEPWSADDPSFKNRAEMGPYLDGKGAGFKCFLRHPDETNKTYIKRDGTQGQLSYLPIQARMDPARMQLVFNSLKRLIMDKEYTGRTIAVKGNWYNSQGEVIRQEGAKGPAHLSTIITERDADGCIVIGIKEEKHPEKEQRPGAKFKFNSGLWFDVKDNDTNSNLSPAEDSKENALAMVTLWEGVLHSLIPKNWDDTAEERERLKQGRMNGNNRPQQSNAQAVNPGKETW